MFKKLWNNFFPSHSSGLDIGDESIKFIELLKTNGDTKIIRYGEKKVPKGIIESGKIKDASWFQEIIMSLKREEGLKSVHISLPHELLCENTQDIDSEISDPLEDIIRGYLSLFKDSGLPVESFGFEAESILRSVIEKNDRDTYMIINFDKKRTTIFIVSEGKVMFSTILKFGGVDITHMIEKGLDVSFSEAEKIKKEYELNRNHTNKRLSDIFLNIFSILRDEINRHFVYWHIEKDENGKERPPIKKIILCGSDSNIKGFPEYLSVAMRNKVELANVWINILNTEKDIPNINFDESFIFAPALGIALNGFDKKPKN